MSSIPIFPQDQPDPPTNDHTKFDILLGKEKSVFNHSGNKRFRMVVNYNVHKYVEASTKTAKTKLVRKINEDMKKSGFRFLKKKKDDEESLDVWYEIEDSNAREKLSHALRDRVRELRKPERRRGRSHEEVSPMIFSMPSALRMQLDILQGSITTSSPSTHMLTYSSLLSNRVTQKQSLTYVPESTYAHSNRKFSSETLENAKRRSSLLNILGPMPQKTESDPSLRLAAKPRNSQMGVNATPRKLPRSLSISCQGKDTTKQSRRSSLESLFSGMSNDVAGAKSKFHGCQEGMFGSVPDSRRHSDIPVKYISTSYLSENLNQTGGVRQPAKSNRRLSMARSFAQDEDMFCSAKFGRRLSMLSLSFEDFSQSCFDHEHEQSATPDRRMSMVSLSLEGLSDKIDDEEELTKKNRRLSTLSSFSSFASSLEMLDSSKPGRRFSMLSSNYG
mmetsp:Transcript_4438/g.6401  ORF Transcript_4438/g.6401 Transcript_4438/m.6401 type:complete len:446 (+) Transcript_4438:120-1457(+)|eukprot:CAMPEP_0194214646 /NCGR_PEP_ID=MMETSP0156-20130528/15965_1 /TAXON_ID=33649 /ORGANISM="Thalassionema nitzschioides, Strain L26-B" /LENGTH=445 /DNA_ID=CAMNT_0038942957 /DNA_START=63 /DNA_END=1400 /DNA_ORIENTATION=+